jgi:hypothetical protein
MRRTLTLAVAVLLLAVLGCGGKQIYPRDEFKKAFLGASANEVRAKLGAPDHIDVGDVVIWVYNNRTKDNAGNVDRTVSLILEQDRVTNIDFWGATPSNPQPPAPPKRGYPF